MMQNTQDLEAYSNRVYQYMCDEVVGSEKTVSKTRLLYKLQDDISNKKQYSVISSGSKAEGLNLPGSDFDIMILIKEYEVYEEEQGDREGVLFLDTEHAAPGFTMLKVKHELSRPFQPTETINGKYLSNRDLYDFLLDEFSFMEPVLEVHGPSFCFPKLMDIDIVTCIKCYTWPSVARKWISRFRPTGWPSDDIISNSFSQGILLVPVGSKSACGESNPLEWRFSFSLVEKLLVHSFNHCQLLCYSLLKIWLKEILNEDNVLNKTLCSYHLKTLIFWILEEDENLEWNPQDLLHCFLVCIKRLRYWIVYEYIPNFFIPEHNMIDKKHTYGIYAYLSSFLNKILENWKIMLIAPSMCNFSLLTPVSFNREFECLNALDKAVLPIGCSMIFNLNLICDSQLYSVIYRIIHKRLPNSARNLCALIFLVENKRILNSVETSNDKNKCYYYQYKRFVAHGLMNTFYRAGYGWLLLAAFFYSKQEYKHMFPILEFSSNLLCLYTDFIQDRGSVPSFKEVSKMKRMINSRYFLKRIKYEIARIHQLDYDNFTAALFQCVSHDHLCGIEMVGTSQLLLLFHYLRFLYSCQQEHRDETQYHLRLLKTTSEREIREQKNIFLISTPYGFLLKAVQLLSDNDELASGALEMKYEVEKRLLNGLFNKGLEVEEMESLFRTFENTQMITDY